MYSFGNDESQLGNFAWFEGNSDGKTHPVGRKKPNAFGLFDMHGNVAEWCGSTWEHTVKDPQGPSSYYVLRGGSWYTDANACRSASRLGIIEKQTYTGVRLAMSLSEAKSPETGGK